VKKLIHSLLFFFTGLLSLAQNYSNEWINFSNKYYKFPIHKTGFYRIDSLVLAKSGLNLSSINPKNFQLFLNGVEHALYIKGEADNVLNASDYIEFFAEKLDGRFDSTIYNGISYLPNPYVSLFSDTISAFLTWNSSVANKRITFETDTASSTYSPAAYFYNESIFSLELDYNPVGEYAYGASDPHYTQAEGYGKAFNNGTNYNTSIPNLNMYTVTPLPVHIKIGFSGLSSDNSVTKDHQVRGVVFNSASAPVQIFDTIFKGFKPFVFTYSLTSNLLDNNSNIEVSFPNNPIFAGVNNSTMLHYVYYKYPQLPILNGGPISKLVVDDDLVFSKTYLKLSGVNTGTNNSVIFYDVTNNKKIETVINGGFVKALVPNSAGQKRCYIDAESNYIRVDTLHAVNQSGYFKYYKSNLADSAFVIITHPKFSTEASNYAAYRQSMAGGSHNVIVADIEDLYDQFAYGIKKHPQSIRNFCRYLMDSLPSYPRNLFIIGKSVQHLEMFTEGANAWKKCLVPSMGMPPSDNLLTAGLKSNDFITPEIPIGRLAAQTSADVIAYLAKVQQHDATSGAEWRKHVLHFAGGTNAGEQALFQSYLGNYKNIIQDTLYGGKVYDFKKTTSAPIQITISDSVKNHFNYGVGIVTFFGHGSVTGFDQAIDDPAVYNNAGKYPLMIANSCYSGNIHTYNAFSNSEKFVLINQKGTIAFIAAASLGFVNTLDYYSNSIYRAISQTKYNKGIGEIVQEACFKSALSVGNTLQHFMALDMTLHGDPAVKISVGRLPDYFIDNSKVSFDLKSHVDSIGILIDITNLGKAKMDTIFVQTERYFPNNDSVVVYKKMIAPFYKDTLKFFMPIDYTRGLGLNKFKVFVDAYNGVTEENENNNKTTGTVDVFIQGGDLVPIYPYKYAVVPSTSTITLKASTTDPFASSRSYRLQLDTTDAFSSPLQQTVMQSSGGVVEWTVNLPYADSTVYFWRVSKDSTNPSNTFVWRESSFQTITNKHGWGQSHFFQFKNDGYQFVKYKKPLRKFAFENDVMSLFCRTGIIYNIDPVNIIYSLNGSVKHTWNCSWNGWSIAVFDSISGKPWVSNDTVNVAGNPGSFGNCACVDKYQVLYAADFGATNYCSLTSWKSELENFLNAIPPNNLVLAYSAQSHTASSYPNSMYNAFESIGSGNIRTLKDTVPLIIFGRKGMSPGQAHEVVGVNTYTPITLNDTIKTRWNTGFIASEIIGPSHKWNSLHWKVRSLDSSPGDTTTLKLVGIRANGQRDTLSVKFPTDSANVLDLYNYADANLYPYLQLVAFKKDNVHRTSPQLKFWYVLYDEAPECAINPKKGFVALKDTMQEGDNFSIVLPVENVGVIPFTDSLVFTYWIEDANRVNHYYPQKMKAKPFNPGAIILDTIKINSYQYPGNNALWVDVNPPQNARYQKEQYHFNNVARYPFSVSRDITNPLLDVTFDGQRIMNGDIVSAKPYIVVSLKDENKFLALNDTSSFIVYLKKPSDIQEKRVYFAGGLNFIPAQLPSNSCKIEYNPVLPEDGKYILIIQAKDRSNNQSGAVDYRIVFEVVNKSTITQVINYPNPFSTSTRFVFNLTGSEVPEMFNIQIMTITGKIVKTITKDDLGPLHIGRNITQYAWDGKDDFGDKLANGVYLYKVQTKVNGQNIEHANTEADKFFTKELGKMVIMR